MTLTTTCPDWHDLGVALSVRFVPVPVMMISESASKVWFDDRAVTWMFWGLSSTSATRKAIVISVDSSVDWLGIGEITGGSFTGFTTRVKERLLVAGQGASRM